MLLPWLFLIVSLIYLLIAAVLALAKGKLPQDSSQHAPFVSVVICARNEERTVGACLDSLFAQSYPKELLEVIMVDDRSSDTTPQTLKWYQGKYPNLKVVMITEEPQGLTGKQRAMDAGTNEAQGEIILTTDADCVVPPHWISKTVKYFVPPVGMVAGFSHCGFETLFTAVQSCDHIFLEGVASAFASLGSPQSCIGNNLAFRKDLYDELGGFEKIGFTVTEDTALMQEVSSKTGYEILFPKDQETLVRCKAAKELGEFFRQRKRWLVGGMKSRRQTTATVTVAFTRNLLFLFSPLFLLSHASLAPLVWGWGLTFAADFLLLFKLRKLLGPRQFITYYLPFQFFYPFYTTVLGLSIILGGKRVHWKGREYSAA